MRRGKVHNRPEMLKAHVNIIITGEFTLSFSPAVCMDSQARAISSLVTFKQMPRTSRRVTQAQGPEYVLNDCRLLISQR